MNVSFTIFLSVFSYLSVPYITHTELTNQNLTILTPVSTFFFVPLRLFHMSVDYMVD